MKTLIFSLAILISLSSCQKFNETLELSELLPSDKSNQVLLSSNPNLGINALVGGQMSGENGLISKSGNLKLKSSLNIHSQAALTSQSGQLKIVPSSIK